MGEVYLAHDEVLERDVALKVLRSRYAGDEEFAERFRREARSAASLSHPNIVQVYDRGEAEDGTSYIAMEYVPGGTLKEQIERRGPFGAQATAAVGAQIADALRAAHEQGERTPRKNEFSRWNAGKDLSFVPLRPERVVEVRYDYMEGARFRHPPQFVRWRPDRDPASCGYAQLEQPAPFALADVLAGAV